MEEMCEVLDENNAVIRIAPRTEIRDKVLRHRAAFVIVINDKGKLLAVQRSPKKKTFPLKWTLGAGGGAMPNETFEETAQRELEEEIGIKTELKYLFDFQYTSKITNYFAKVYLAEWNGKIKLDPEECRIAKWLTPDEIKDYIKKDLLCPDTALFFEKYLKIKNQ